MNSIDLVIIGFTILAIIRGVQIGFFRQALSLAGFFSGLLAGSWASAALADMAGDPALRVLMTFILTLGMAMALSSFGEGLGRRLQEGVKIPWLRSLESGLGVVLSVSLVLVSAWMFAALFGRLPTGNLAQRVDESVILRTADAVLPPAPSVFARLDRMFNPGLFPNVFVDREPNSAPIDPPSSPVVRAAAAKAQASTVKIIGLGCGGIGAGSGFITEGNLVITNAHVVAGARNPLVIEGDDQLVAEPIWFNPELDVAILRVDGLDGPPLQLLNNEVGRGTAGAVLGYPGGGRLTVSGAAVLQRHMALGRNIYDRGLVYREVYELQTTVEQGNSGGPFVLPDGTVAGLIFGKSTVSDSRGYAITSDRVIEELEQARAQNRTVDTGVCVMH